MDEASKKFAEFLQSEELNEPLIEMNMNGVKAKTLEDVLGRLERGLVEPVNFVEAVANITADGKAPTLYKLSARWLDSAKGEIPSFWGRFANDTLKTSDKELKLVVI